MKNTTATIVGATTIILFTLCFSQFMLGVFCPVIHQDITDDAWFDGERRLSTKVWYQGDIVWSRYDVLKDLNDSTVNVIYNDAVRVKKVINNIK